MIPKITIENSMGQKIETLITSERSKILTFRKKRWYHNNGIFQMRSTCIFDPGPTCRLKKSKCQIDQWKVMDFLCLHAENYSTIIMKEKWKNNCCLPLTGALKDKIFYDFNFTEEEWFRLKDEEANLPVIVWYTLRWCEID